VRSARCVLASAFVALIAATHAHAQTGLSVYQKIPVRFMGEPGQSYEVPLRTIKQLKYERMFRTTVQQQFDYSCGSAALATLLTYHYNRPVSEQIVFKAMFEVGDQEKIRREGFSLLDMKRVLAANGYTADGVEVSLDDLAKVGVPAIVLVQENGYNHFVVIKGLRDNRVVIGDPALGTRILPREQFEAMWKKPILFVIRSHRDIAKFNQPADWEPRLAASMDLAVIRDSLGGQMLRIPSADSF
jgi:hypothetical protein